MFSKLFIFTITFVFSLNALSSSRKCEGYINSYRVSADGFVIIMPTWAPGYNVSICNLYQIEHGVLPQACQAWLSTVEISFTKNLPIKVVHDNFDIKCDRAGGYNHVFMSVGLIKENKTSLD